MKIKNEIGFTLAELMISLMIMGIMAAIATPEFNRLIKNYKLANAARMVWLDVHKAKMMAIKQRQTMRLDFTPTSYNIVRTARGVVPEAVAFTRNLSGAYRGITVDTSTTASMSFDSTGTAKGDTTVVIQQGSTSSNRFTIALTGRIGKICNPHRESCS